MGLLGFPAKANIVTAGKCRTCTAFDISNIRTLKVKVYVVEVYMYLSLQIYICVCLLHSNIHVFISDTDMDVIHVIVMQC
jgi:hypothetical protein